MKKLFNLNIPVYCCLATKQHFIHISHDKDYIVRHLSCTCSRDKNEKAARMAGALNELGDTCLVALENVRYELKNCTYLGSTPESSSTSKVLTKLMEVAIDRRSSDFLYAMGDAEGQYKSWRDADLKCIDWVAKRNGLKYWRFSHYLSWLRIYKVKQISEILDVVKKVAEAVTLDPIDTNNALGWIWLRNAY